MQAVIFPELIHFIALFSAEVLHNSYATSLRESEKFAWIFRIYGSENERMINRVDVAIQECSTHGVSSSANNKIATHNISLKTSCLKARYMLSNRDENFASEMTAFFDTRFLILNMDPASTRINEHLY
jgi:hypothetical protein